MTTKSMEYAHPTYTCVQGESLGNVTGNAGTSQKFAAWTSLILKSMTLANTVVGTSASDVLSLLTQHGTVTTTTALSTFATTLVTTNVVVLGGTSVMAQGDVAWLVKGTDATGTYTGTLEYVVQPTAPVTV